jgi:hypothetical protein
MPKRLSLTIAFALSIVWWHPQPLFGDDPESKGYSGLLGVKRAKQEMLEFTLIVTDTNGEPVEGAEVGPWALRSSQGHGQWNKKAIGGTEPVITRTDASGQTIVLFPKFADVEEQIKTTAVTVSVDHPDHPFVSSEHVEIPCGQPHALALPLGAAIEVAVTIDGQRVAGDEIYAMWTGGRSWRNGNALKLTEDGTFRIPPMAKGPGQFMFIRLDDETPTHFSPIEDVEIDGSEGVIKQEVELLPGARVRGEFSDNVPRPVRNGRVKVQTISDGETWDEVTWFTWAKVDEDGTFVIESWPKDESMQLVALCDGFNAKSGKTPPMVKPERAGGGYLRAQVFLKPDASAVTVEMTPMAICNIEAVNAFGKPLEDVGIAANPNIGWWNGGSQIYGWPLVTGAQLLLTGKYEMKDGDGIFAQPFQGKSDEQGKLSMELPVGATHLWAGNKRYQLPAKLGRRYQRASVDADKPLNLKLVMQPKGLDVLGDWEDLCGLVFG